MYKQININRKISSSMLGLVLFAGCQGWEPGKIGSHQLGIVDVPHTPVERQSIGNCWLYAQASWVESMHLSNILGVPDGEALDVSQSYWTYWHWFDQVTGYMWDDEISTGGNQWKSHALVRDRGLMLEADFVFEDSESEMSARQASAQSIINEALAEGGELGTREARQDGELVRRVFDEAWGLSDDVRAQLDQVFGADGETTLRWGGEVTGTKILDPNEVQVRFSELENDGQTSVREVPLVDAISEWETVSYPYDEATRREFLLRVQRALHDRQPVVITWDVDFNALGNNDDQYAGSFNMQTLEQAGGPGRQGGHMTVLEDYAAITAEHGLIEAAVTLDPEDEEDAAKLAALLRPDTQITLLRTKNSWGADRPDRRFAPGFPGYHDLWIDYLNGPIRFCPSVEDKTDENCTGETTPLREVMLPPGY